MRHAASDHNRMPECEADLAVKRGRSLPADTNLSVVHPQGLRTGACPNCGAQISEHVAAGAAPRASHRTSRRDRRYRAGAGVVSCDQRRKLACRFAAYARGGGGAVLSGAAHFFWFSLATLAACSRPHARPGRGSRSPSGAGCGVPPGLWQRMRTAEHWW